MGGGQFRFGIVCSSGTIQEEYQVELSILEADGLPWQNKPVIRGDNKTQIYEGERGEILSLQIDSYDFLKEEMVLELRTVPPNLQDQLLLEIQPNYLLPYARPGDVKFTQNAKLSLINPVDPNDFGGEFNVFLRAKSWINNETLGIWSEEFSATVIVEDVDNLPPVFESERSEVSLKNEDFMNEEFLIFNASAVAEIHHHIGLVKLLHPNGRQSGLHHAVEIGKIAAVETHSAVEFQRDQLLLFPSG